MPPPEQRAPFPDRAHEALAVWVEETLTELGLTQADAADGLTLLDVAFALVDELLQRVATAREHIVELTARVATLEGVVDSPPFVDSPSE